MNWEATDQFGNMYIGASAATSRESLLPDVVALLGEMRSRIGIAFQVTFDYSYQEINAPDPENVVFVVQVPWLASLSREVAIELVGSLVEEAKETSGLDDVQFVAQ